MAEPELKSHSLPCLILGIGNLLLSDEGVGIHAINALRNEALPSHVKLEDGGTGGVSLLRILDGYEKIIVIDAVDLGEPPGAVRRLSLSDLEGRKSHAGLSVHGFDFSNVLDLARTLDTMPSQITIIGIQPGSLDYGTALSEEVEKSIETVRSIVLEEISHIIGGD